MTQRRLALDDEEVTRFVADCLVIYEQWYGSPLPDCSWPVTVVAGTRDLCCRNWVLREYTIAVRSEYTQPEQVKAALARRLYQRVTMTQPGLRQRAWVDGLPSDAGGSWPGQALRTPQRMRTQWPTSARSSTI